MGDDVDAHWWGSPDLSRGPLPPVTPLTLSLPTKATPFRIILWRCWSQSEHGIARFHPAARNGKDRPQSQRTGAQGSAIASKAHRGRTVRRVSVDPQQTKASRAFASEKNVTISSMLG